MEKEESASPQKHGAVDRATSDLFIGNGQKILQIASCGSPAREIPDTKSQTIQFDEESVTQLKGIIGKNF